MTKNLRFLIQNTLQKKGHLIMSACDGKMALDWLTHSKPDLVVLDIGLPDMSGLEVCKKIKGEQSTRRIPVIILTGFVDNQTKMQANLKAHADLFLNKPLDNNDLISAVNTLLEKSSNNNTLKRNLFKRNGL